MTQNYSSVIGRPEPVAHPLNCSLEFREEQTFVYRLLEFKVIDLSRIKMPSFCSSKTIIQNSGKVNSCSAMGDGILLTIAFLLSPMGLPMLAVWILSILQGISQFIKAI